MTLKNILIVVSDLEVSIKFYTQIFDMRVLREFDNKIILTGGLVLQDKKSWENCIDKSVVPFNNTALLYFEVVDIALFAQNLQAQYNEITYLNRLSEVSGDSGVLRFYDMDGNLIEVREQGI